MVNSLVSILAAAGAAVTGAAGGQFGQALLEETYDRLSPAMGLIEYSADVTNPNSGQVSKRSSNALGVVVSPGGLVLGHGHLVLENKQPFNITVTLGRGEDEKTYDAVTLKKPDDINVVLLQIQSEEPLDLSYLRFSRSHDLGIGSPIAIYGVLGESFDYTPALLEARIGTVLEKPRTTYCIDRNLRFGYVGGPVVDTRGRIVGVVGFDMSRNEGGDLYTRSGQPLVYQAGLFLAYIDNPPSETQAGQDEENAWLGVFTQPLTEDLEEYWELELGGGLVVSTLVAGSPAEAVGLRVGDIITNFDGTPIRARLDRDVLGFTKLVRETDPGRSVRLQLVRGDQAQDVQVTLGVRPRTSRDADEYQDEVFGLTVREITTDVRIMLNLAEDVQGVIVRLVRSGSAAQMARMRPGVIILSFGDYPVTNLEEFRQAVEKVKADKPAEVSVFARMGAATGFFRLEPRWQAAP